MSTSNLTRKGLYRIGRKVRGGRGDGASPVEWKELIVCASRKAAKRIARAKFGLRGLAAGVRA